MASKPLTFAADVNEAIEFFEQFGFRSRTELEDWVARLRRSAILTLQDPNRTERELHRSLGDRYKRLVDQGQVLNSMPGVQRFTLDRVKPKLRAELDRRIMASANLIRLNQEEAVNTTLRRFQGWATSIPAGGSNVVDRKGERENIRKSIAKMPFLERRVVVDQTHKLVDAVRDIVAVDGGAIAAEWHSPWRRQGYDFRKDHKERDEKVYAIRDSWALVDGLMKAGPNGYVDDIERPGELPMCSCSYQYLFSLRKLPVAMLTKKGMFSLQPKAA